MRQAIATPYYIDQNEPSKPLPHIVELADDARVRHHQLRNLYFDTFDCEVIDGGIDADRDAPLVILEEEGGNFGDITIRLEDDEGVYLYITYLKS